MKFSPIKKHSIHTKVDKKYSYCQTTSDLNLERFTIRERLDIMANIYPDKVAFIFNQNQGLKLTYSEVRERSTLLAKNFQNLNLNKGDRIAYLMPNTHEILISYFASAFIGLVSVPLDPENDGKDLEYMIEKTEPKAIIIYNCAQFQSILKYLLPEIDSCTKEENFKSTKFPYLEHVILIDDHNKNVPKTDFKGAWNFNVISKILIRENKESFPFVDSDDLLVIFFSSGTTAKPKGIMSSQFSLLNNAHFLSMLLQQNFDHSDQENIYCQTPTMYHVATFLKILSTLFRNNITLVFPSYTFEIKDILESIEKYKCTTLNALSKIIVNFLNFPFREKYNLSSLTRIASTGQLVTLNILKRVKDELAIKRFWIGYGMTEINYTTFEFLNLENNLIEKYDNTNIGTPGPFIEAKIINPQNGLIQPLNKEGELLIRGYNVTRGYFNQEDMTRKAIDSNAWIKTGDIAVMGENGKLYFRSRSKEIITVKGSDRLDIYPGEIETCLLQYPGVKEAVVFGIPINDFEQEVCAWIKLDENDKKPSKNDLIEFCRDKLVEFKIPRYIKYVQELPMSTMGKYQRNEMQKRYKQELGL